MSLSLGKFNNYSQEPPSLGRLLTRMRMDVPLLMLLFGILVTGLVILYSAGGQSVKTVLSQTGRIFFGLIIMWLIAMVPPHDLKRWTPRLYILFLIPLVIVLYAGVQVKGSARWINLGLFRFQPSEVYKVIVPMMIAWMLAEVRLPIRFHHLLGGLAIISIPLALIVIQPDLGTALMVAAAGLATLFLAGLSWRIILGTVGMLALGVYMIVSGVQKDPIPAWIKSVFKPYQIQRIKTLVTEDKDKRGTSWQSDQSDIAIGSGGLHGKGYLSGTQSQHGFLPEAKTDFIFAVVGEEFGFYGSLFVLMLYLLILFRCLWIATSAQDTYSRLLAGTLGIMFMLNAVINMLMVSGVLPVVGLPLPIISYGGTSVITLLAGFGILMSIQTHKKLI